MRIFTLLLLALLPACSTVRYVEVEPVPSCNLPDLEPDLSWYVGFLAMVLPPSKTVEVIPMDLLETGRWGVTYLGLDKYIIGIDPRLTPNEQIMVLAHEWAHTLANDRGERQPHGDIWGQELARVHRAIVGEPLLELEENPDFCLLH